MARLQATLKTQLVSMGLYGTEAAARTAWAEAFTKYFEDAVSAVTSVPVNIPPLRVTTPPAVDNPKDQMDAALAGLSTGGAVAITAGITAFWVSLFDSPPAYFAAATAIALPAGLAGLTALLDTTFAANIAAGASKDAAMTLIAADIHTVNAGGTVTFPGPLVENIL